MVFPAGAKEKEAKEAAEDTVTSCDSYGKNFYALPNTGVSGVTVTASSLGALGLVMLGGYLVTLRRRRSSTRDA